MQNNNSHLILCRITFVHNAYNDMVSSLLIVKDWYLSQILNNAEIGIIVLSIK